MSRITCLFIPLFPLAARLRAEPELNGAAVVVCEGNAAAARVVGASRSARSSGLEVGMTLAQARSILPDLIARGRDPGSERSAHEALLEVAWSLSPRVEAAAEDTAFADVDGMEQLFAAAGGEQAMAAAAMLTAERLGLFMRVGLAANKLAARVAAHTPPSPRVVPAGEEAAFLAPLPLTRLRLERRLITTLGRWGVHTIGGLAALPADRVASRLGPAGVGAHLAARGIDPQPLTPLVPQPTLDEGMELEWAVVTLEPLLYALRQSVDRLQRRLEGQDLGCAFLELELGLEPEGTDRRSIRLPAPTREAEALIALLRLELEGHPPGAPVSSFRCMVHPDRPRRGQLTLFGAPEIHPDHLATTMARLAARLGPERVGSPRAVDGHLPERYATAAFAPPPPPRLRQDPGRGRGLLAIRVLRPPVPLEVITEEATNPKTSPATTQYPVHESEARVSSPSNNSKFKIQNSKLRLLSVASEPGATPRIQGLVRVASGPWNLEEGWWNDEPVERQYWDVELSGGGLYRLYRDGSGEWFADGMYD